MKQEYSDEDFEESSTSITSFVTHIYPGRKMLSAKLNVPVADISIQLEKEMPESIPIEKVMYSLEPDLKLG